MWGKLAVCLPLCSNILWGYPQRKTLIFNDQRWLGTAAGRTGTPKTHVTKACSRASSPPTAPRKTPSQGRLVRTASATNVITGVASAVAEPPPWNAGKKAILGAAKLPFCQKRLAGHSNISKDKF